MYDRHLREVLKATASVSSVIPAQRALHKTGFSFSTLPFDDQLSIWNYIWKTRTNYYSQLQAFLFLDKHIANKAHHPELWSTSKDWQNDVTDWSLCDALAKINTKSLESLPDEVYPVLKDWNSSDNQWMRRQSLVSLLYFSRTKKVYLPFERIAVLVTPLLKDKKYYVQKGLGWTLREMHTVYPEPAYDYIAEHIKSISAIAFTIAIEKMTSDQKIALKSIRR